MTQLCVHFKTNHCRVVEYWHIWINRHNNLVLFQTISVCGIDQFAFVKNAQIHVRNLLIKKICYCVH